MIIDTVRSDNLELCEYLVGIKWLKTFPLPDAKKFSGAFANQNVVCKLRDASTIESLKKHFSLEAEQDAQGSL